MNRHSRSENLIPANLRQLQQRSRGLLDALEQGVWSTRQGLKFVLVGGAAAIVDIAIFAFLLSITEVFQLGITTLGAKVASMTAAVVIAFFGHDSVSFSGRKKMSFGQRALWFFLIYGVMALLQLLALDLVLLVSGEQTHQKIGANALVIALSTIARYILVKNHVFQQDVAS